MGGSEFFSFLGAFPVILLVLFVVQVLFEAFGGKDD